MFEPKVASPAETLLANVGSERTELLDHHMRPQRTPRIRSDRLIRNIAVGRKMKRSATNAATMENALSQPNRRNDGRSENTVTTRPQANTTVVRISAGPTSTVARSTATAELTPGWLSSRSRLRKWMVADRPRPNDTVSATTLAN